MKHIILGLLTLVFFFRVSSCRAEVGSQNNGTGGNEGTDTTFLKTAHGVDETARQSAQAGAAAAPAIQPDHPSPAPAQENPQTHVDPALMEMFISALDARGTQSDKSSMGYKLTLKKEPGFKIKSPGFASITAQVNR